MRQKVAEGRVNSTATLVGPANSFFTETTRHSFCSPMFVFCVRSLCSGAPFSPKAISAPRALTTSVSSSFRELWPFRGASVQDNGNAQLNPLAAAFPRPML